MAPKRPTSVLVIAIFHLIFGTFGLIAGLVGFGFAAYVLTQPQLPPGYKITTYPPGMMDTMRYMDSNVPGYRLFQLPSATLGLALPVTLLVAGIGLILMKPWARVLSLVYGICSIVYQLGAMLYIFAYMMPAQMALYENVPPPPGMNAAQMQSMTSMMKTMTGCSGAFGVVLVLIYPIIVLIIMFLPSVKVAFSGAPDGSEEEADRHARGGLPPEDDYGRPPTGYGGEPDDRFGAGPR